MSVRAGFSSDVSYLETCDPRLAKIGNAARRELATYPAAALMKLRTFGELLAKQVASRANDPIREGEDFKDLTQRLWEDRIIGSGELAAFENLRRAGNQAVHGLEGDSITAHSAWVTAVQLAGWFRQTDGRTQ